MTLGMTIVNTHKSQSILSNLGCQMNSSNHDCMVGWLGVVSSGVQHPFGIYVPRRPCDLGIGSTQDYTADKYW